MKTCKEKNTKGKYNLSKNENYFTNEDYSNLYKASFQNANNDRDGYVNFDFLNIARDDDDDEISEETAGPTIVDDDDVDDDEDGEDDEQAAKK